MSKELINRIHCDRKTCETVEEVPGGWWNKYPSSWKKVEGSWLCPKCTEEYYQMLTTFMQGKGK